MAGLAHNSAAQTTMAKYTGIPTYIGFDYDIDPKHVAGVPEGFTATGFVFVSGEPVQVVLRRIDSKHQIYIEAILVRGASGPEVGPTVRKEIHDVSMPIEPRLAR